MKIITNLAMLLISFSLSGCAFICFDKKLSRSDINLANITISRKERPYYTIALGENPNKNIIFYFTGTGCHDPSNNASALFDNLHLNSTILILPKIGVLPNQSGKNCSSEYLEYDNLEVIANDTHVFINKKLSLIPGMKDQKVILYGESEGADIAVRLANHFERVTDIVITHRGMGLNNTDERNLSHKIRFKNNNISNIDSIKLTNIANGTSYPPEMLIFKRKAKNWREFFSIKEQPIAALYNSKKKIFIYLGRKDITSPVQGLHLSIQYFCRRGSKELTAIIDKEAGHRMIPYFNSFSNLKDTVEQWLLIGADVENMNLSYPLEKIQCR